MTSSLRINLHVGLLFGVGTSCGPITISSSHAPQSSDTNVKRADRIAYLISMLDFFAAVASELVYFHFHGSLLFVSGISVPFHHGSHNQSST
jgi:hypothetical protein